MEQDTNDDRPYIVQLGAGEDDSVRDANLDVSGTVGPDYLGQETTTVDGHWADRPGVKNRLPENSADQRVRRMDTGQELPVLLSSDMRSDPIEGTQGSFTQITEGECARCGYDRLKESVQTMAGEQRRICNACGAIQNRRSEHGYRLPRTEKERARRQREAGPTLGSITNSKVVDLEPDTGFGAMITLVRDRSYRSLYKDDVEKLFWMLVENGDISVSETLDENLTDV